MEHKPHIITYRHGIGALLALGVLACGGHANFGTAYQNASGQNAKNGDHEPSSGTTQDTQQASTTGGGADNGGKATVPVQVSGAFLTDCQWLGEDLAGQQGLAGCRVLATADHQPQDPHIFTVKRALITVGGVSTDISDAKGDDTYLLKFGIKHEWYGRDINISVEVAGTGAANMSFPSAKIASVPASYGSATDQATATAAAIGSSVATSTSTSTQTSTSVTPTVSTYDFGAFKLGDDGLGKAIQCGEIEAAAVAKNAYGKSMQITFTIPADNTQLTLKVLRVCGNGSGNSGSATLAHWDIVPAGSANKILSGNLLQSSLANDLADQKTHMPTATTSFTASMFKGTYTLIVYAGQGATAGTLDDMVAQTLQLNAVGLTVTSSHF